jgi:GNAT superfamily N-acetyltransferase
MIRDATEADHDAIVVMARQFMAFTPYADVLTATDDEISATIRHFIAHAKVFVADIDGTVLGVLFAVLSPAWYAPSHTIATELAWWVAPEHRKGTAAIRLIQAFERWAKDSGASMVGMSNLEVGDNGLVSSMLARMDYRVSEQTHVKRIV